MMPRSAICKGYDKPILIPMTGSPSEPNQIHSPRVGNPHSVPPPVYPGEKGWDDIVDEFWDVRDQVNGGRWPKEFLAKTNPSGSDGSMPHLLRGTGIEESKPLTAAQYVAMDDPADLGIHLFKRLVKEHGVKFKRNYSFFPFSEEMTKIHETLNARIRCAHELGWQVKCYYGLERPETVFNLPPNIVTTDKYGAPNHFSYVANHATGYGATSFELDDRLDLEAHVQLALDVLDALWQGAMYRTLHGVHWWQDNAAGFDLGLTVNNNLMVEVQTMMTKFEAMLGANDGYVTGEDLNQAC